LSAPEFQLPPDATPPDATPSEAPPQRGFAIASGRQPRSFLLFTIAFNLIGTVLAVFLPVFHGVSLLGIALLVVFYTLTGIGVHVGFHRYFSHRSFAARRPVRLALAVLGSMAMQGPPIWWASIHRRHHQFSDRPGDPHSPHLSGDGPHSRLRGLLHAHVGWLLSPESTSAHAFRYSPELVQDRTLMVIERLYVVWVLLGLALPALIGGTIGGTAGALEGFLWGGVIRIALVQHVTFSVNSLGHVFGARDYQTRDRSTNSPWHALVDFGDGWHNNHHAFPSSARHGLHRSQVDLGWWVIRGLETLGLVTDVQEPRDTVLQKKALA
jgi:stearoyl-CoA desaturase (Delta-9 desaturase)